jgi:NAD(P)-dependent dehydrogenase (short-subunit alcohol dehydrogenase family)
MLVSAAPTQQRPELLAQTVVVIGGRSGIGLETARRARAEGADVILTARDPERLRRVMTCDCAELFRDGGKLLDVVGRGEPRVGSGTP